MERHRTIPKKYIRQVKSGIDISGAYIRKSGGKAVAYENVCFTSLAQGLRHDQAILLGPHLSDYLLGEVDYSNLTRPDSAQFTITPDDQWILTWLYEFKSRRTNGIVNKLHGLPLLIDTLRSSQQLLVLLQEAIGEHYALPNQIIIPNHSQIGVTFVSPPLNTSGNQKNHHPIPDSPFLQVDFKEIPFPKRYPTRQRPT